MRVNISSVIVFVDLTAVRVFNGKVVPVVSELSELHIGEHAFVFAFLLFNIILCDFFIESAPTFLRGFFRPRSQHIVLALLIFNALCHSVSYKVTVFIVERILLSFRQNITSFLPCGKLNNTTETLIYPDKFLIFQRIKILQNINDIILADSAVSNGSDVLTNIARGILADTEQRADFLRVEEVFPFPRTNLIGDSLNFGRIFFHICCFLFLRL